MIPVLLAYYVACGVYGKIRKSTVRSLMEQPTQFSATPLSAQGSYGDEYEACSSRVLQLSNSTKIGKWHPKIHYFSRLSNVSDCYADRIQRKRGLTLELHFSVARTGYGGLRVPFYGITEYLRSLVSVYERPIITGVRLLMVYSKCPEYRYPQIPGIWNEEFHCMYYYTPQTHMGHTFTPCMESHVHVQNHRGTFGTFQCPVYHPTLYTRIWTHNPSVHVTKP